MHIELYHVAVFNVDKIQVFVMSGFFFSLLKGQMISKLIFGVLDFSQKTNSFVRFLGEFEDTKSPFEII